MSGDDIDAETSNAAILKYIQNMDVKFDKRFDEIKGLKVQQIKHDVRLNKLETENKSLREEVKHLSIDVNQMQQSPLNQNIIVRGIPEIEENDSELMTIIRAIMSKVADGAEYEIQLVTRLGRAVQDEKKSASSS